jgi:MscS family membrane protein
MDELLKQVWLENEVKDYLLVISIILFIVLFKRYISRYLASIILQLAEKAWKDIDKRSFTTLIVKPLGFFLVMLVSVATLHRLKFPQVLNAEIYRITFKELLHMIGSLAIIISFIRLLVRAIDFIAMILQVKADRTADPSDNQLIVFFKDFFKVVLVIIGLLMVLKFAFGYRISNLLTGVSLVAAAIALALRESLENLIASFIIFFDKPFTMGDVVKVHNFTGTVEKIGLRSTRIRTDQKTFITVPNKQMVDSILDNLSQRTQRKGELRLEIGLSTPSGITQQLVRGLREITSHKEIESSSVLLNDITSTAQVILVEYFTGPITMQDFNIVKEEVNYSVLKLLEEMNVEIAGASTEVKLSGQSEESIHVKSTS